MKTKTLFKIFNISYIISEILTLFLVKIVWISYPTSTSIPWMDFIKILILIYPIGLILIFFINFLFSKIEL